MEKNEINPYIDFLEFKTSTGIIVEKYPILHLVINDNQQYCCVGGDLNKYGGIEKMLMPVPGIKNICLGRLDELPALQQIQIRNSLFKYDWDFVLYDNPEIVLLTQN